MDASHVGQSFSDFLDELGIREDVEAQAIKKILVDRLRATMQEQGSPRPPWPRAWVRAVARSIACSIPRTRAVYRFDLVRPCCVNVIP